MCQRRQPAGRRCASIVLGWAFGVVNGVVIGRFDAMLSVESMRADPFTTVTGGIVGLSAPRWPGSTLGWAATAVLLTTIAVGLSSTGWLMAQPHNVRAVRKGTMGRNVIAVASGVLMGGGIGLVLGLSRWLASLSMDRTTAFVAAFSVIGVSVFGMLVWVRSKSAKRTVTLALGHAVIWIALCWTVFHTSGLVAVVALTAANAWYHATWFTAAFVVARTIGSRRAAVAAAAIEGAGGFVGFVTWRMISG